MRRQDAADDAWVAHGMATAQLDEAAERLRRAGPRVSGRRPRGLRRASLVADSYPPGGHR